MEGHFRSRKYVQNQSDESHGATELYRLVSLENRVPGGWKWKPGWASRAGIKQALMGPWTVWSGHDGPWAEVKRLAGESVWAVGCWSGGVVGSGLGPWTWNVLVFTWIWEALWTEEGSWSWVNKVWIWILSLLVLAVKIPHPEKP